ncbi:hypothetical protein [Salinivirga cyanobacteriivorans]
MKHLVIITILLLAFSCTNSTKKKDVTNAELFHEIIEKVILQKFTDIAFIIEETRIIKKEYKVRLDSSKIPPPPPPYLKVISKDFLHVLVERNCISIDDVDFMHNAIDETTNFNIDSTLVSVPVIPREKLSQFGADFDEIYDNIYKEYGKESYVKFSFPIFNESRDRLIFFMDYHCGPLCGQGYTFVLSKEESGWQIIQELGGWES